MRLVAFDRHRFASGKRLFDKQTGCALGRPGGGSGHGPSNHIRHPGESRDRVTSGKKAGSDPGFRWDDEIDRAHPDE
jgi:hypothetical protein